MKKWFALLLALVMSLSLVACGGSDTSTDSSGDTGTDSGSESPTKMTLILRGGAYGEVLEACLPAFEEEHNVDIEVLLMSFDDLHTGIALDAVNSTGTYDLCMVDGSWMAEWPTSARWATALTTTLLRPPPPSARWMMISTWPPTMAMSPS